jgi:precorrin-4 methylase
MGTNNETRTLYRNTYKDKLKELKTKAEDLASRGCPDAGIAILLQIPQEYVTNKLAPQIALGRARRRQMILDLQLECARKGNATMLVFLGKNELGQVERAEVETTIKGPLVIVRRKEVANG